MKPESYRMPENGCFNCIHSIHSTQLMASYMWYGYYCRFDMKPHELLVSNRLVDAYAICDEFKKKGN